jgi:hypothetical protein
VAALATPDRRLQRDVARLLTAAHTLGLSLGADRLGAALASPGNEDTVGDALGVLRDEHIVVDDGTLWRGLHELRSATISELLHENPPPTIGKTWSRVVDLVDPPEAGWMLRRVAERAPDTLPDLLPAVSQLLACSDCTAADVARLLEGAERADNTLYVHATTPILRAALPPTLNLGQLATMAYPMRNQGVAFDPIGSESWDRPFARIRAVADQMPARADVDTTLQHACAALTTDVLERLLEDASLVDAVRLLEAGRQHLTVPIPVIQALLARAPQPRDLVTAMHCSRLIAACAQHVDAADLETVFGPLQDRALAVATADPWTLDVAIDRTTAKIRVERLLPICSEMPPAMEWDIPRANAKNILNTETVGCLERLVDACPELRQFEIRTLTASGTPHLVADHQPAYKDMAREAFPERTSVRQSVGYQAALRRATASQTWTEIVVAQIEVASALTALAAEIPLRIKPHDNSRRRNDWRVRLTEARARLAALDPPPMARGTGPTTDDAHDDDADRTHDATTQALSAVADALDRLCPEDPAEEPRALATAMNLRSAVADLRTALTEGRTVLDHRGSPIPDDLINNLERAANLAAALHTDPTAARSIHAADPLGSADQIWEQVREQASNQSRDLLAEHLASIPSIEIQHVVDPEPQDWSLDGRAWLITAAMDDLDMVVERLAALTEEERDQLGTRPVVLAVGFVEHDPDLENSEGADEAGDDSGGPRRVSLDVGVQLSSFSSQPTLPLTPEMVADWAEAGGVTRLTSDPASPITVLEGLIVRSVNAALSRMRRLPWLSPIPAPDAIPAPEPAGDSSATEAADLAGEAVAHALEVLESQVAAEEAGSTTTALAGLALSAVTGGASSKEEELLLNAIAILHFARYERSEGLVP